MGYQNGRQDKLQPSIYRQKKTMRKRAKTSQRGHKVKSHRNKNNPEIHKRILEVIKRLSLNKHLPTMVAIKKPNQQRNKRQNNQKEIKKTTTNFYRKKYSGQICDLLATFHGLIDWLTNDIIFCLLQIFILERNEIQILTSLRDME